MSRPFRYTFILGLVALATGLAAVGGWRYARASAPVNGPIILLSVDGLRTDRLGAYGVRTAQTTAIDALAADGVVFERAYSNVPQTLPAHATLLSGRLPFETGVRDNVGFVVKDEERLLPEMLRDRGFATAAVVSNYALRKETGISQGFGFFDADMSPASEETAIGGIRRNDRVSEVVAEHWLDRIDTSRLFLFLHLHGPEAPYTDGPGGSAHGSYDSQVTTVDESVGRFVHYLKAHQLYDRSTIILISSYGEGLEDHGEQTDGLFVYEEALHVPLIIKQPAAEGAGRRVAAVVQHVDVVPTILDLAKAPASARLIGRSLKPFLDGSQKGDRRLVYAESLYGRYHFGWSGLTSITDGRYRYIRAPREELYDLQSDPGERHNLAQTASPDIIDPLRHELKQFGAGDLPPAQKEVPVPERERLDALGYVGAGAQPAASDDVSDPIDPKDKYAVVEIYRAAIQLGISRKWFDAMDLIRGVLRSESERTDIWNQFAAFALRVGRDDQAASAYKRIIAVNPGDAAAHLGAAAAFFHLQHWDEARRYAGVLTAADSGASPDDQSAAHMVLAEIALARRDTATARAEAALVADVDPKLPMTDYVEARLLSDQGRLADSLPYFDKAAATLNRLHGRPIAGLHAHHGDVLSRLKRYDEAEAAFLAELELFPENNLARVALAGVYHETGRPEKAAEAMAELTRLSPTPDAYRLTERFWETKGDSRRASAVRAEARQLFDPASRRSDGRASQQD